MILRKFAIFLTKPYSCNRCQLFSALLLLVSGTACNKAQTQSDLTSNAAGAMEEIDVSRVTLGQKAPAFHLLNQHSVEQSLDSLLAKGKVALVFYRSADW